MMAGRGEHKSGKNRLAAVARQRQALELRKAGHTFEVIASQLGYAGPSGAFKAVTKALRATLAEPADELRRLEGERLDALLAGLWPKALVGHPRAAEVALRVMDRRAALLGLDAPRKVDVTLRELVERVAAEDGLSAQTVMAEAEAILRGDR